MLLLRVPLDFLSKNSKRLQRKIHESCLLWGQGLTQEAPRCVSSRGFLQHLDGKGHGQTPPGWPSCSAGQGGQGRCSSGGPLGIGSCSWGLKVWFGQAVPAHKALAAQNSESLWSKTLYRSANNIYSEDTTRELETLFSAQDFMISFWLNFHPFFFWHWLCIKPPHQPQHCQVSAFSLKPGLTLQTQEILLYLLEYKIYSTIYINVMEYKSGTADMTLPLGQADGPCEESHSKIGGRFSDLFFFSLWFHEKMMIYEYQLAAKQWFW